ncbi:MAG: DUF1697 domain-containing protein [Candidatus Bathyarchaeota archaeon]|nr:DUF1697 domain-containing protein [Candidatus Bathyarchaeota archaeon]
MAKYVAFLRGINIIGHNILKMEELRQQINSLGFKNVSTYKQSGNIIFETSDKSNSINKKIQRELYRLLGVDVKVFLRTMIEVEEILQLNPFKKVKSNTSKLYVTFLPTELSRKPRLPLKSTNKDVEVILLRKCEAFSLAYKKKGRFGYPNNFIEKKFNILASTRNWKTIKGIVASARLNIDF